MQVTANAVDTWGCMASTTHTRVLVVDDLPGMREFICRGLEHLGFRDIAEARDGAAALESMTDGPVGLIISDYDMPGMDGLEFLTAVRADARTHATPFILVSGNGDDASLARRAARAGADDYVAKPFTIDLLRTKIEGLLGRLD